MQPQFTIRVEMPNNVELIITSEGDNGILFEGTEGRFFVNRGKLTGKPVEDLKDKPLPEGAIEKIYGGKVSANHTANFIEGIRSSGKSSVTHRRTRSSRGKAARGSRSICSSSGS